MLAGVSSALGMLPYERPEVSMRGEVTDPGLTSAFVYEFE